MDRELPDSVIRRRKLKILLLIIAGLVLVVMALRGFRRIIKPTIKRSRIMTAIAEIGTIEDALISSGIVVPEFEQVITSPIQSKIDSVFIRAGEIVSQGQSIVKLDDEFIQRIQHTVVLVARIFIIRECEIEPPAMPSIVLIKNIFSCDLFIHT